MTWTWWEILLALFFFLLAIAALVVAIIAYLRINPVRNEPLAWYEDTTNQALTSNTPTVITFNTKRQQRNIWYDATTGTFTVNATGMYAMVGEVPITSLSASGGISVYILVNSITLYGRTYTESQTGNWYLDLSAQVPLNAGDTFQLVGLSGAGTIDLSPTTDEPTRLVVTRLTSQACY